MINQTVNTIYECVAGLAIYHKTAAACRRRLLSDGRIELGMNEFRMTEQLDELAEWLAEWKVTNVAMECEGVKWLPILSVLEGKFDLHLVNTQLKKLRDRDDAAKEAAWIAESIQCGLLQVGYVTHVPKDLTGTLWIPVWNPTDDSSAMKRKVAGRFQ